MGEKERERETEEKYNNKHWRECLHSCSVCLHRMQMKFSFFSLRAITAPLEKRSKNIYRNVWHKNGNECVIETDHKFIHTCKLLAHCVGIWCVCVYWAIEHCKKMYWLAGWLSNKQKEKCPASKLDNGACTHNKHTHTQQAHTHTPHLLSASIHCTLYFHCR